MAQTLDDSLITLTKSAVSALLKSIASGTHEPLSSGQGVADGSVAYFSAKALNELMECSPLHMIIEREVTNEIRKADGKDQDF